MPAALLLAVLSIANFADYPRLRSDTQAHYVSSYDRTGGNDDGFDGTYSAPMSTKAASTSSSM